MKSKIGHIELRISVFEKMEDDYDTGGVPTCTQIRMCVQLDAASTLYRVLSYSKTCLKRQIKNSQNDLNDK